MYLSKLNCPPAWICSASLYPLKLYHICSILFVYIVFCAPRAACACLSNIIQILPISIYNGIKAAQLKHGVCVCLCRVIRFMCVNIIRSLSLSPHARIACTSIARGLIAVACEAANYARAAQAYLCKLTVASMSPTLRAARVFLMLSVSCQVHYVMRAQSKYWHGGTAAEPRSRDPAVKLCA